jgi:hypothetical protein
MVLGDGVPIDRRPELGAWGCRLAILFALLLLATPVYASPVASPHEPTPRDSYEQRWASSVRYCARRVSEYTKRPVVYQISAYGTLPRYTDERQERLLWACFDALGLQP